MKIMKALALLVCMLTIASMAFAEDGEIQLDRNTMTGVTEVSLTVDNSADTYIVVIPSKVTIDPKTQYGYGDIVLKSGWELISVNNLKVKLSEAANGIEEGRAYDIEPRSGHGIKAKAFQNFKLKSAEGKTATYAIASNRHAHPFTAGADTERTNSTATYNGTGGYYYYYFGTNYKNANLISVVKGGDNQADSVCKLTFYVDKMPDAGVYTDTLTFSIITE